MNRLALLTFLLQCELSLADGPVRTLTLQEALDTAARHQPRLREAGANTRAAWSQAAQALAPNLPQLRVGAAYQRTTANFAGRPGSIPGATSSLTTTAPSANTFNFFSATAQVDQVLWDFGQGWGRYRAAQASAQAEEENEEAARVQTALAVRTAYFNARAQNDLLRVSAAGVENQRAHHLQIEQFVKVGRSPPIDLAQARADLANARVRLLTAQHDGALARARLSQAMGINGGLDFEVIDPLPGPLPGEERPLEQLVSTALEARPEAASFERRLRAQELTVQALKGAFFPALGTRLGGTMAGTRPNHLVPNVELQLTLDWAVFSGGLTRAQLATALAQQSAIEAQRDAYRLQVRIEVEQARLSVEAAKGTRAAAEEVVAASRERLTLAEGRYREGVGSGIELGDAQVAFTAAGAQRVQAEVALATARAELMASLGLR